MDALINITAMFAVGVVAGLLVIAATVFFLRKVDRWAFPEVDFADALKQKNLAVGIFLAAIGAAFILGLFLLAGRATAAELDRYNGAFRKWGRYHFGYAYDWQWFKAQGMTESGLNPEVCSHVGACGLMQFMPGTAAAMGLQDRFNARASIRAGIAYDRRLWRQFTAPRPPRDRLYFAFMSYNAGLGNVLAFQRAALAAGTDPNLFETLRPHVWPEPREYVLRIQRWHQRFVGKRWGSWET